MMEHLTRCARTDVRGIYQRALGDKAGCGIIRAKRASDQAILASILMCRPESKIARFIPSLSKQVGTACLSSPVISTMYSERVTLFQGLILLGIRQFKKQGVRTVLLDYVSTFKICAEAMTDVPRPAKTSRSTLLRHWVSQSQTALRRSRAIQFTGP